MKGEGMRTARKRPAALEPRTKSFVLDGRVAGLVERMAAALHTSESALVNAILDEGAERSMTALGRHEAIKDVDFPIVGTKQEAIRKFRPSGQALSKGRCAFCGDAFYIDQWAAVVELPRMTPGGRLGSLLRHAHVACARAARYRPGGMTTWSTVDKAPLLIWMSGALEDLKKDCAPRRTED
jgi:hypothetical protein